MKMFNGLISMEHITPLKQTLTIKWFNEPKTYLISDYQIYPRYLLYQLTLWKTNDRYFDWQYLAHMTVCCLLIDNYGGAHSPAWFSNPSILCYSVPLLCERPQHYRGCSALATKPSEDSVQSNKAEHEQNELSLWTFFFQNEKEIPLKSITDFISCFIGLNREICLSIH
jgi:hypothetical protein